MKKILPILFIAIFVVPAAFAQTKNDLQLSLGGEFGLPTGLATSVFGSVAGASAKLEVPVSTPHTFITFTAGLSEYIVRLDYTGDASGETFVPLEAGIKTYFSKIGYVEVDGGLSANLNSDYAGQKDAFIFSPIIGFSAPMKKRKSTIDIGLRYDGRVDRGGEFGQVALRVAYRFKI
jgi:hypothetical protein